MFCCTGAPHDSCRYPVSRVCGQLLLEWGIAQLSFLTKSIYQVSPEQGKNKSEIIYSFTISSLCRGNTVSKCFFSLRTQFPFLTWCSIFFFPIRFPVAVSVCRCTHRSLNGLSSCSSTSVQAYFGLLSPPASEIATSTQSCLKETCPAVLSRSPRE